MLKDVQFDVFICYRTKEHTFRKKSQSINTYPGPGQKRI